MFLTRLVTVASLLVSATFAVPMPLEEPAQATSFFKTDYDVLVIGGGPAGLQNAMSLGRLRRTALVIDSQEYRNNATLYAHDVITLDGTPPPKMRALARADLLNYPSVDYTVAKIATIENVNNGTYFLATDTNGTKYTGRKVMLATGSRDILPNFPGMDVIWGTGAFWCLWCDGWEHRDAPLGVLSFDLADDAITGSLLYNNITIYSNGTTIEQARARTENLTFPHVFEMVKARGINIDTRIISNFSFVDPTTRESSIRITFSDGSNDILKGILIKTPKVQRSNLAKDLGVAMDGDNMKAKSKSGDTNVFGVYIAGDMAGDSKNVPNALYTAKAAAVRMVAKLSQEDARLAANMTDWRGN